MHGQKKTSNSYFLFLFYNVQNTLNDKTVYQNVKSVT